MTFNVLGMLQGSDAWFAARLGRLTGTGAEAVVANGRKKGEPSVMRGKLIRRLVTERVTGVSQEPALSSEHIERGDVFEPVAVSRYEAETGVLVQSSGFLACTDLMAGCSLDGHVGAFDGILEIKCPKSETHFGYLRSDGIPSEYRPQIIHNLWITGAAWCDFVSFDDRFPTDMQLVIRRVLRDDKAISEYADKARAFLAEVEAEYQSLFGWKAGAA